MNGEQNSCVLFVGKQTSRNKKLILYLANEKQFLIERILPRKVGQRQAPAAIRFELVLVDLGSIFSGGGSLDELLLLVENLQGLCRKAELVLLNNPSLENVDPVMKAGVFRCLPQTMQPEDIAMHLMLALENRKMRQYAYEKQLLAQLLKNYTLASEGSDLDTVLDSILQGIQSVGFDRARLYLAIEDGRYFYGRAQVGMRMPYKESFLTLRIAKDSHLYLSQLQPTTHAQVYLRPNGNGEMAYDEELDNHEIKEWVYLPLIHQKKVIGLVVADNLYSKAPLITDMLESLVLFAQQAASAINNASFLTTIEQQNQQLEQLHEISLKINTQQTRRKLLKLIVTEAVNLLQAKSGGIYEYDPNADTLKIVADYGRSQMLVGKTLKKGEGMAGRLIDSSESYLIVDDYDQWSDRAPIFKDPYLWGAVLEVPLRWERETLGIIYVDDEVGREFTPADANLLRLFSDQAAIAMLNTKANKVNPQLQQRLTHFSQLGNEFIGRLSESQSNDTLSLLCNYATQVLQAERCELFLALEPNALRLEARCGNYQSRFKKGLKIQLDDERTSGLITSIAYQHAIVRLSGEALSQKLSTVEKRVISDTSKALYAAIGLPLVVQRGGKDVLLGVLRADNKIDENGRSGPENVFTEEDEWLLKLLGNFAIVAIEGTQKLQQAQSKVASYEHLFAASPSGVIANDHNGEIVFFSRRAKELLGYTQEEAIGQNVVQLLFKNAGVAYRVGLAVRAQDDLVAHHQDIEVIHKDGRTIPLSLSTNKLLDAQQNHIGYVGYFEDHRELIYTRERYKLLLELSNILSQAKSLRSGLKQLAEQMVHLFNATFCRIFLIDDTQQYLNPEAVAFADGDVEKEASWEVATRIADWRWANIDALLNKEESSFILANGRLGQKILIEWSRMLDLTTPMASLLIVPIRTKGKVIGLLDLGDFRLWTSDDVTEEKKAFVVSVASQAATHIDRMQSHAALDRRTRLLTKLDEMTRQIRSVREPSRVLEEVVRLAVELAGCEMGGLFVNDPESGALLLMHSYKMPESLLGQRVEQGEGLVGAVVQTGKPCIENKYRTKQNREAILSDLALETVAGFPIMRLDAVNGVLMVADTVSRHWVQDSEREALERFARHATAVLHASQLFDNRERLLEQLDLIRRISEYIQETPDFEKQLHIMMTAITARFGLRFNRAALFLYEEENDILCGSRTIGHFHPEDTRRSWELDAAVGKDQFPTYKHLLETDALPPLPLETRIQNLRLPVQSAENDLFSYVIHKQNYQEVTEHILYRLPKTFIEAFAPKVPAVIVPLKVQNQMIGLIVVDNHVYHEPITPARVKTLLTLTNACAIAINNGRLLTETEQARHRLNALYQAGKTLVSGRGPREVWQAMIKQLHQITKAKEVRMLLIDKERGAARDLLIEGEIKAPAPSAIRKDGYSMKIMRSGQPELIEDAGAENSSVNPTFFARGFGAAVGLPVLLYGETIGVVWIYYDQPGRFSSNELEDYQVYVNNSALAYDRAQRIMDLDNLRKSAGVLTRPVGILETAKDIVEQATLLLDSHSAALWAYDHGSSKFILDESVAHNIPDDLWASFKNSEPKPDQTTYAVLENGYVEVPHIMDPEYDFITESTYHHLTKADISSMQGVTLAIGEEKLGVLYINRQQPGSFSKRQEELTKTFAQQAAMALKNARLMERANKAREAARVVANKIITLDDSLDDTLNSVVHGVKEAMRCDAVTLFSYREDINEFIYPPKMAGVNLPELAVQLDHVEQDSIVFNVLQRDTPFVVDDTTAHPAFQDRRFVKDEKIKSCAAFPLRVGKARVGALFANYRSPHRFQSEELLDIELLANEAAVAIHNAQLLAQAQRQTQTLASIHKVAHAVTTSIDLDDILQVIVLETQRLFANQLRKLNHASVWLIENEFDVRIVSDPAVSDPASPLYGKKTLTNWADGIVGKRIGITGRALSTGESTIVNDVSRNPDYIASHLATKSELAVPIKYDGDIVGAINVEGAHTDMFTERDVDLLEMMAEQTAVAISHLQSINTLHIVAAKLSGSLDLNDVMTSVMSAAIALTHADASSLLFWDVKEKRITEAFQFLASKKELEPYATTARSSGGLTRRIIDSGEPIIENDTAQLLDVNKTILRKNRKSVIGIPVKTHNNVIAVLYVSSQRQRTFTLKYLKLLEALVGQSAMAIDRVRHYDELQKTKRIVGARTALAWMGMTSSRWRHRIEQHAIGIKNSVFLLEDNLIPQLEGNAHLAYLCDKLVDIDQLAKKILDHEITPPLGSDAEDIFINELISERVNQLWQHAPYNKISFPTLELEKTRNKKVKSSMDWLRLALDNLIDNALEAMQRSETAVPQLRVMTRKGEEFLEILIKDNGPGMPQDVLDALNSPSMEPKVEDGNLGRGLLMVQAIADAYNGSFSVKQSGREGTTVVIALPTIRED